MGQHGPVFNFKALMLKSLTSCKPSPPPPLPHQRCKMQIGQEDHRTTRKMGFETADIKFDEGDVVRLLVVLDSSMWLLLTLARSYQ